MSETLTIRLNDPQQGHHALSTLLWPHAKALLIAGHKLDVETRLHDDAKTDLQRKYYHGIVLKTIAEQARPNGQQFPLQVWKEHFRKEYLGSKTKTFTNPMTGRKSRRRVRISTEDLGIRAYSKLIDRVSAFAATELGVTFPASYDQWEQMQVDPDTGEIMGGVLV